MFQDNQVLGVCIAMGFISGIIGVVLYFTRNLIAEHKILFLLIFLVALLNGVLVTDKVIAFKTALLDKEETKEIISIDVMLIGLTTGHYMNGGKKSDKDDNNSRPS